MFARYPKGRLTLRDLIRVKFQRMLIKVALYGVLLASGALDGVRAHAVDQAPMLAAQLESVLDARRAAQAEATTVAKLRADCRVSRGDGIVFHSAADCPTR